MSKKFKGGKSSTSNLTQLKSDVWRGSRWGIKGVETITGGYSIGFTLENGFSPNNGVSLQDGRIFGRESTLNIQTPYGKFYFGRIGLINSGAGPMSMNGWYSPFGTSCRDYSGAANNYMWGHQRFDNMYSFMSPSFKGFQIRLQYSSDTNSWKDLDSSIPGIQHGEEGKSTTSHYYAAGLKYKTKSVGYSLVVDRLTYSRTPSGQKEKDGYSVTSGGYAQLNFI